jgi:hypothetical protein
MSPSLPCRHHGAPQQKTQQGAERSDYGCREPGIQGTFVLHQSFRTVRFPTIWRILVAVSRNMLVVLIAVLIAGLAATGYALYKEKKQPDGVEISIGKDGLSIKEK